MNKEISAGIIVYRRTEEGIKFLLLYHRGRYWNFPKGHLEQEESSYLAALREVKEETGLSKNDLIFHNFFKLYERYSFMESKPFGAAQGKQKIFKIVAYFLAETKKWDIRVSEEHSGYGWFLYRDGLRILVHKNSREHLRKAFEFIRQSNKKRDVRRHFATGQTGDK